LEYGPAHVGPDGAALWRSAASDGPQVEDPCGPSRIFRNWRRASTSQARSST